MEKELTPELIEKAKQAKTAEELLALAKENEVELTAEEANTYFAKLNPKNGELSDDELDQVAGGGCTTYKNGRPVVTSLNKCDRFVNQWTEKRNGGFCDKCMYSLYTGGLLLCYHPQRLYN